jgi:hypothetical protein
LSTKVKQSSVGIEIHAPKFTLKYLPGGQKSVFTGKQSPFELNE